MGTGQVLVNWPSLSTYFVPLIHVFMSLRKYSIYLSRQNFIESRAPLKSLQSLKVIWWVSVSPICILLQDFQCCQKRKKDMIFVGVISRWGGGQWWILVAHSENPAPQVILKSIVITAICIIFTSHRLSWVTEILVILFKGCSRRLMELGWS